MSEEQERIKAAVLAIAPNAKFEPLTGPVSGMDIVAGLLAMRVFATGVWSAVSRGGVEDSRVVRAVLDVMDATP